MRRDTGPICARSFGAGKDEPGARVGVSEFREAHMNVKVVVHAAEEGGFWAEVPALPGCVSQGETMDELLANMREAIQAWLASASSATG